MDVGETEAPPSCPKPMEKVGPPQQDLEQPRPMAAPPKVEAEVGVVQEMLVKKQQKYGAYQPELYKKARHDYIQRRVESEGTPYRLAPCQIASAICSKTCQCLN